MAKGAIPTTKNDKVRVSSSDTAPDYLDQKIVSSDGSVTITTSACDCSLDLSATNNTGFQEQWIYTEVSYTLFNSAAAVVTATPTEWAGVPAGSILMGYKLKHDVAFAGGTVSACTASVHINGATYSSTNVFTAPSSNGGEYGMITAGATILNQDSTDDIQIRLTCTGDNCDNLTAGTLSGWVKIAVLI